MRSPRGAAAAPRGPFAGRHGVHALPHHALAGLHALRQGDAARVVAQHLHAAQLQRVFLRLDDPDGGLGAVMEQRRRRHRVGSGAVGLAVVEADVGGHAQPHLGRGRLQRQLGAIGAALRIGRRRDLAQHGAEGLAGQGRQRDGGALADGQARQHAFGHVAQRVDVARPGQVVDRLAGRHVLPGVGLFSGDDAGVVGHQGGVVELIRRQGGLLRRLVALRQRRGVGVAGLLELVGGDQVFAGLGAVAVQLLLGVVELVLRGRQLGAGGGGVLGGVGGVEPGDHLAGLDRISQAHLAFNDLATHPERQRRAVARLHFARQGPGRQRGVGLGRHGHHRARRGCLGLLAAAAGQRQRQRQGERRPGAAQGRAGKRRDTGGGIARDDGRARTWRIHETPRDAGRRGNRTRGGQPLQAGAAPWQSDTGWILMRPCIQIQE